MSDVHGPFQRAQKWSTVWVTAFVILTAALLVAVAFKMAFAVWAVLAAITWLPMELFGVFSSPTDPYPPLTQITREYVPRWVTFPLLYGAVGLGGGTWFDVRLRWWVAALGALLGWLTAHFDVTYDGPAVQLETMKYQWYAKKLGLSAGVHDQLAQRQKIYADAAEWADALVEKSSNLAGGA